MSENFKLSRGSRSENGEPVGKANVISLQEVWYVILRNKFFLLLPLLSSLIVVFLYNYYSTPIYETSVKLKKEQLYDPRRGDAFKEMFVVQSTDELETEIEIVKTKTVLDNVIDELSLCLIVEQVQFADGESQFFDFVLPEYNNFLVKKKANFSRLPRFSKVTIQPHFLGGKFYLKKNYNERIDLVDAINDSLISSALAMDDVIFELPSLYIDLQWMNAKIGDKFYFNLMNENECQSNLEGKLSVASIGKTNLFELTVKSPSPFMAQLIANTVVENYREIRFAQKRQTTHYSFEFVNSQVDDISQKLKQAEVELSEFKSNNEIVLLDVNSKQLMDFISQIETEKVKIELELADYQNKLGEFRNEIELKGYFDQTHLSPQGSENRNSPFSVLMEQLANTEIARLRLLEKRKQNHPDVVAVNNEIDQIKKQLTNYNENTISSYEIIQKTLQKKRTSVNNMIRSYKGKMRKLPAKEIELAELLRQKNLYEKMLNLFLTKREELRLAEFSELQDIVIIEAAPFPYTPVSPRKTLNILVSIVLSLALGVLGIIIREFTNRKITTLEYIEQRYDYPVLAILPPYDKKIINQMSESSDNPNYLVSLVEDQDIFKESYRVLRAKLLHMNNSDRNVILFTSSEGDTGKTSVVSNLAISLAQEGHRVLVMDCDLKKPEISKFFCVNGNGTDLVDYLTEESDIKMESGPFKNSNPELKIDIFSARSRADNSSELLASHRMGNLLQELSMAYDYILIDTAPVTKVVDTLVLGKYVKDVILIVRPNHTFKDSFSLAVKELEDFDMNILGLIVNGCSLKYSASEYKYGYGYGYQYGKESSKVS